MKKFKEIKIGFFLASRQIKNANLWVNILIVFVMTITFLNLVFISGLLEGLVTGASKDSRNHYSGDIIITPEENRKNIINTKKLEEELKKIEEISSYSIRYFSGAQVKAEYSPFTRPNVEQNSISAVLVGIDFKKEDEVTNLSKFIVDGDYIYDNHQNKILIGSGLLSEYESAIEGSTLDNINIGDKIKINISGSTAEYDVGGVVRSKIGQINNRIFIDKRQLLRLTGSSSQTSDEIAIKLNKESVEKIENIRDLISQNVFFSDARVETWQESQGQFFDDLSTTFTILGAVIGAIGLAVASITLFIVIFINAISREKYIGILKGIGVQGLIIKYSYILQSIFYAFVGSTIGVFLLYTFLVPYFDENPIDFPFSDGILDITYEGVLLRITILFLSSIIAGVIPSHFIVKKNTIDSILGR